eukprot:TRINITY_DN6020_c4_g1_i1.p1 TRINITY_DN6020_c4_g1~~TRINITY_DN6020_c4_g1_i1.p1  ORF type:complete len:438 (-),score=178.71 TRINITY_DN6020_c4_g1_i1:146-1459(-)
MSITSEEVNILIYRYLLESGFLHTAFCFKNESGLLKKQIPHEIIPGALISYIQKGLLYKEMELHTKEDGTEISCTVPVSLLQPHICKIMDEEIMQEAMQDQMPLLKGHNAEVYICAWNPTQPLLASGSADATAIIWNVSSSNTSTNHLVLQHTSLKEKRDVTTIDWNCSGTLLATGSCDGIARIWDEKGDLKLTLSGHNGPIFALKWNKKGDLLLSCGIDQTARVWETSTGDIKQIFEHKSSTLDVDWQNASTFATCSSTIVYIYELGKQKPIKCLQGHKGEINAVKWDFKDRLLASCSDDFTAKIWSLSSDKPVQDFTEHTKEIFAIEWSPSPIRQILASASLDTSIKLWDAEAGTCLFTLTKHTQPVYSVSFSPCGEYLASGSYDKCLHIWSVKDASLIKTFKGKGGIFDVSWNNTGDKIAACLGNSVSIVDFRF